MAVTDVTEMIERAGPVMGGIIDQRQLAE